MRRTCPRRSPIRMKILLDENFPLALVPRLREAGYEVEHVILLGLRGQPDSAIIKLLESEARLLLRQDQEFLERSVPT
jgi:predicted nuclease of predicted toxin-antitoxin system